jgi:hypothetical protein
MRGPDRDAVAQKDLVGCFEPNVSHGLTILTPDT